LQILPEGHPAAAVLDFVRSIQRGPDDYVTVVLPEMIPKRTLLSAIRRGTTFYLKVRLLSEPQVVITDVPVVVEDLPPPLRAEPIRALIPKRTEVVVFISAAHDATARAINYARTLKSTAVRAVYFAFDAHEVQDIQREWEDRRIPIELDIVEAPFRDLTAPVLEEVGRIALVLDVDRRPRVRFL